MFCFQNLKTKKSVPYVKPERSLNIRVKIFNLGDYTSLSQEEYVQELRFNQPMKRVENAVS